MKLFVDVLSFFIFIIVVFLFYSSNDSSANSVNSKGNTKTCKVNKCEFTNNSVNINVPTEVCVDYLTEFVFSCKTQSYQLNIFFKEKSKCSFSIPYEWNSLNSNFYPQIKSDDNKYCSNYFSR
jgi:hypothetical protein